MEKKLDESKTRTIIIETDGNLVHLKKAEVSGKIELLGILKMMIHYLSTEETPQTTPVEKPFKKVE